MAQEQKKKKMTGSLKEHLEFLQKVKDSCLIDLSNAPDKSPAITSGSLAVDLMSGIGGFPVGGCIEVAGEWSSGKTTLAICCAVEVQKKGGTVLFVDFEQAFDKYYAEDLGLDTTPVEKGGLFILLQPVTLEEGWNAANALMRTKEVQLCIIDSVAAGIPKVIVESDADSTKTRIAPQAQVLAPEYNKIASTCRKTGATCLLLNQIRVHFEGSGKFMRASKETSGGNALKHYTLMRLWMSIVGKIEEPGETKSFIANKVRFQFIKNKCGRPYLVGTLIIRYGVGIDNESAILEMATEAGLITLAGSHFKYGEITTLGRQAMRDRIANDSKVKDSIVKALKEAAQNE